MQIRRNLRKSGKTETPSLPLFDDTFLRRLERLSLRTAPSLSGAMWGERRSRHLRPTFDFSDHRPYTGGDDLRHVDWKIYGRHEELFVKLGEAPQSVNVHILLDSSASMAWRTRRGQSASANTSSKKWDAARQLAAALGYLGLVGGDRMRITPFAHTLYGSFGPTRGKRQVLSLLRYLAETRAASPIGDNGSQLGLEQGLTDYARGHPSGGLLILVSDLLDETDPLLDWSGAQTADQEAGLAAGLRHFARPRWQVSVVHLLSKREINPTLEGDVDLQDVETGQWSPFRLDEDTVSHYRRRVHRWCDALKMTCGRNGATYSRVLAEWPFEQAVIPCLRQRGVFE